MNAETARDHPAPGNLRNQLTTLCRALWGKPELFMQDGYNVRSADLWNALRLFLAGLVLSYTTFRLCGDGGGITARQAEDGLRSALFWQFIAQWSGIFGNGGWPLLHHPPEAPHQPRKFNVIC